MKRALVVATFASLAVAGIATPASAGAFCLFYCPKYCTAYCQACCPFNAFSSNGCLMGCCPPPAWPYTGYGCGGCGAYNHCGNGGCCNKCGIQGGNGHSNASGNGCCGKGGGGCAPACGPCCRMKAPTAMHLVTGTPRHLGEVCCHCGMDSYGNGGLRNSVVHGKGYKGGACAGESCGNGYDGALAGPALYPQAPAVPVQQEAVNPRTLTQFWTANMTAEQAAANYMQPVSYQGYYYPMNQVVPNYGYGYNPYFQPMYNPAMYPAYGYQQGW